MKRLFYENINREKSSGTSISPIQFAIPLFLRILIVAARADFCNSLNVVTRRPNDCKLSRYRPHIIPFNILLRRQFMLRRDFLSSAAIAATGLYLSDSIACAEDAKQFTTKIKKADIGNPADQKWIAKMKEIGFDGMETWIHGTKPAQAAEYRKFADSCDFEIHSTIFGWSDLNTTDSASFDKQIATISEGIETTAAYGGTVMLWVPARIGGMKIPQPWEFDIKFDEKTNVITEVVQGDNSPYKAYIDAHNFAMTQTRKALDKLIPVAEKNNIIIGLENVWNNLWVKPDVFANFVNSVDNKYFQTYFDIGNHVRYAKPEDWFAALGKTIVKLHVKGFKLNADGHGGDWCSFRDGSINWPAVRQCMEDIGYNGYLTLEQGGDRKLLCEQLDLVIAGK